MSEEEKQDNSAKARLEARRKVLDEYEKNLGVPAVREPGDIEEFNEYFSMDRKQLEKMSGESAAEICIRLAQFSFYLTRCLNRERGNLVWAEGELNSLVAGQINNYSSYTKHEIKVATICRTDAAAAELQRIITYANQRITRLEGVAESVKNLSHYISMLSKVKYDQQFSKRAS